MKNHRLLTDYVRLQAEKRPEASAVVLAGRESLTYGEIENQSNRLANLLLDTTSLQRGDRVGLFLEKSSAAIVAMHGVMKTGAIYVPIDVSSPVSRLAKIVESCRPKVILADRSGAKILSQFETVSTMKTQPMIGWFEKHPSSSSESTPFATAFGPTDLANADSTPRNAPITRDDPAHILFTSGSTGIPKGVVLTHRNVTHFVEWGRDYFQIGPDDRNSGHSPFHFDLSTFDIFGCFAGGAQLHLVPALVNLLPSSLARFIRESELTQWFSVPSALTHMARGDVIRGDNFPSLRRVMWCGEVLPTSVLIHLMERLPDATFTNLYGPTETTIASSFHTLKSTPSHHRAAIPIGKPCPGEKLMVLDAELQPVPEGSQGDLYIGGAGLSQGYWEDPVKTSEAFLTVPEGRIYCTGDLATVGKDGLFYFQGRNDSQIKSRGYRIELGEIEAALNSLGLLRECAVVGTPSDGFEGTAICCAYVPQRDREPDISPRALRSRAAQLLPGYMLPNRWKSYSNLPKTSNGKCDRRKIKEAFLSTRTSP